jgi:hypothetical protein
MLYLVDLKDYCITVAEFNPRYVALSYVWGLASNMGQLMKENLDVMTQPGSLKSTDVQRQLPGTIQAAMDFAQLIGLRYLWVDRLCIVQNDLSHKTEQINAMGAIYFHSYLTLAAADNNSAENCVE